MTQTIPDERHTYVILRQYQKPARKRSFVTSLFEGDALDAIAMTIDGARVKLRPLPQYIEPISFHIPVSRAQQISIST